MNTPPVAIRMIAVVAAVFVAAPLVALGLTVPWTRIGAIADAGQTRQALGLSLASATTTTLIALVLGVPLAHWLATNPSRLSQWVRGFLTVPLVLPPVVGGVALLALLGRKGLLGPTLEWAGVILPFTFAAVVLSQTFVSLPFLVVTVEGAMRSRSQRLEPAAATLGATPWQRWWRVTLPSVGPGIAAGAALVWARSLGEFGATLTFAGSFPGTTKTLPLYIYETLATDRATATALSAMLVAVSSVVLIALRGPLIIGLTSAMPWRRVRRNPGVTRAS